MTNVREFPSTPTPCTTLEFFDAISRAWVAKFDTQPRRESLLVLVSQWAEETGFGKYMRANNPGNAKSVVGDGHDFTFFRCSEIIGGREVWFDPPDPATRFRAFASLDEGAVDYLELLWHRFGRSWGAVLAGDPAGFARALKAQGYYTAAEPLYEAALVALYQQIDRMLATPPAPTRAPDLATTLGVQQALVALGFGPLRLDGVDGLATRAAVARFQRARELLADGVVGPLTRAALASRA